MGAQGSKSSNDDDRNTITIRKQIGRKSSVNILKKLDKRSQSDGRGNSSTAVVPALITDGGMEEKPTYTVAPAEPVLSRQSTITTVVRRSSNTPDDYVFRPAVPDRQGEQFIAGNEDDVSETNSIYSADETPRLETPLPLLPPPPVLEEESPTKYGLKESYSLEPEYSVRDAKRRTASGPELFKVSVSARPLASSGADTHRWQAHYKQHLPTSTHYPRTRPRPAR